MSKSIYLVFDSPYTREGILNDFSNSKFFEVGMVSNHEITIGANNEQWAWLFLNQNNLNLEVQFSSNIDKDFIISFLSCLESSLNYRLNILIKIKTPDFFIIKEIIRVSIEENEMVISTLANPHGESFVNIQFFNNEFQLINNNIKNASRLFEQISENEFILENSFNEIIKVVKINAPTSPIQLKFFFDEKIGKKNIFNIIKFLEELIIYPVIIELEIDVWLLRKNLWILKKKELDLC